MHLIKFIFPLQQRKKIASQRIEARNMKNIKVLMLLFNGMQTLRLRVLTHVTVDENIYSSKLCVLQLNNEIKKKIIELKLLGMRPFLCQTDIFRLPFL